MKKRYSKIIFILILIIICLIGGYKILKPSYFAVNSQTVDDQAYVYKLIMKNENLNDLYIKIARMVVSRTEFKENKIEDLIKSYNYELDISSEDEDDTYRINLDKGQMVIYYDKSNSTFESVHLLGILGEMDIQCLFSDGYDDPNLVLFKKCKNSIDRYFTLNNLRGHGVKILDDAFRPVFRKIY